MNAIRLILFLILLIGSAMASASVHIKMGLESQLESRIRDVLSEVDPYAKVIVKVELKAATTALPGANTDVLNLYDNAEKLDFSDIRSIDVSIHTSLEKFPDWLKAEIENLASVPKAPTKVAIKVMDEETKELMRSNSVIRDVASSLQSTMSKEVSKFYELLMVMGGVLVVVLFMFMMMGYLGGLKTRKLLENQVGSIAASLAEGMGGGGGGGRGLKEVGPVLDMSQGSGLLGGGGGRGHMTTSQEHHPFDGITPEAVIALFSDCYWGEQDGYAAWIWHQLSPQQRQELMTRWSIAEAYSKALGRIDPVEMNHHTHPSYLNPLGIEDVSVEDLTKWLRKEKGVWHYLSPMRQQSVKLTLSERIDCIGANPPSRNRLDLPMPSKERRKLTATSSIGQVSIEDELAIFENPEIVPEALRAEIHSLVWFALLPKERRESILESLSADSIAQAWIGPDPVLARLTDVIPEKKLKLVQSYAERIRPNRESAAFKFIVQEALKPDEAA